ncbi:MAG: DUF4097 family beta strand repeat-containing protein [Bacteroidetes bacterium]|nr:DUF4097 family beta strand repeat-containing protein [Bacteroidota bacterium]
MKTLIKLLPLLALIFILVPRNARAHDDYIKVIKKEFTINPDAQFILENKFGQVHCNNWDKNSILLEVRITVTAGNQDAANKLFGLVNIVTSGTPSQVEARTVFTADGPKGNSNISVDYIVSMPATVNLNLTNKFGDVYLNDLSGKGNINLAYGDLDANRLLNSDNVIDIKFGKANVQHITGAMLTLKYSEMKVGYAGSLFLDGKYSDLDGDKVISLSMGMEGGKVNVENTSAVTGKSRFADLNIGTLDKKLDLDIQYGNCDVDNVAADFSLISIRNKYGDVSVNIPTGTSYTLEADLKFCDLDFPEDQTSFTQKISTNTSKTIRGTVGKKPGPEAKVIVKSEFGNVSLE